MELALTALERLLLVEIERHPGCDDEKLTHLSGAKNKLYVRSRVRLLVAAGLVVATSNDDRTTTYRLAE